MNERELEEKFCAVQMAVLHVNEDVARRVFRRMLRWAVNDKIDEVTRLLQQHGSSWLLREIQRLREE